MAEKLKEIRYNGEKVITEAAKRDSQGNVIKDTYAKTENVYNKEEVDAKINEVKTSYAAVDSVYGKDDIDQKISNIDAKVESKVLKFIEVDTLPETPETNVIYIINGEQKAYDTDGNWVTVGTAKQTFKTINGVSILGEGDIKIESSPTSPETTSASFKLVEVDVLPDPTNAAEGTIYLIKKSDSVYDEYVLFNNELIPFGSTNSTVNISAITDTLQTDVEDLHSYADKIYDNCAEISTKVNNIKLDNYYTKKELDDGYGDFTVNGEKVTPNENNEVILLAQSSYEISGRLNGHLIIDGSAITDPDTSKSTTLKLNNVYINSDVETAILYTGKYKTLNIYLTKDTANYLKCERDSYVNTASKAAVIYAQEIIETDTNTEHEGNIDISGNGVLYILSKGYHSHGIKAGSIRITGIPYIYITLGKDNEYGHDGIHAASELLIYGGQFYMNYVNDAYGTGDAGYMVINDCYPYNGCTEYIWNYSGTMFDCGSNGEGYILSNNSDILSNDKWFNDVNLWSDIQFTSNLSDNEYFTKGYITLNGTTIEPKILNYSKLSISSQTEFDKAIRLVDIYIKNADATYSKTTSYTSGTTYFQPVLEYELTTSYDNTSADTKEATKYNIYGYIPGDIFASGKSVRVVLTDTYINGGIIYNNAKKKLTIETFDYSINMCNYIQSSNNLTINSGNESILVIRGSLIGGGNIDACSIAGSTVSFKGDGIIYSRSNIKGTEVLFGEEASDDDLYIPEDLESNSKQCIYVLDENGIHARLNSSGDKKGSIVFYPNQTGSIVTKYLTYDKLETYDKNGIYYDNDFNKDNLIVEPIYYGIPDIAKTPKSIAEVTDIVKTLNALTPLINDDYLQMPVDYTIYLNTDVKVIDYDNGLIKVPITQIKSQYILGFSETITDPYEIYDIMEDMSYYKNESSGATFYIYIENRGRYEMTPAYYFIEGNSGYWYYESFIDFYFIFDEETETAYLCGLPRGENVSINSESSLSYELTVWDELTQTQTRFGDSDDASMFVISYIGAISLFNVNKYQYPLCIYDWGVNHVVNVKYSGFNYDNNTLFFVLEKNVDELFEINIETFEITKTIVTDTSGDESEKNLVEVIDIPIGIDVNSSTGGGTYTITLQSTDVFDAMCAQYIAGTVIYRAKYIVKNGVEYFDLKFLSRYDTTATEYNKTNTLYVVAPLYARGFVEYETFTAEKTDSYTRNINVPTTMPRTVNVKYDNTLTTSWKMEY